MPLSLLNQQSPYLLQHVSQPVEWMTWSTEAFLKAKTEDKPVFVSIGYAACHWCQEMSRNCFNDPYIASLMNRHFINIIVDREERPDIDNVYMEAVRMFNQSAGWPLNVFCLPDGKPFWGGTYFPKEDMGNGLAPWPQILIRVAEHYRKAKYELKENADNVIANLLHANNADFSTEDIWQNHFLKIAVQKICELHDDKNGGFTPAPKFPSPMKIDFLLSMSESSYVRSNLEISHKIEQCISTTLQNVSKGGIHDHIGGGFFRYSTDEKWSMPHFEKMLSDNALLISTFSRSYRNNNNEHYREVIKSTIAWLNQEMGCPSTGYASSLSAESNGIEGAYYEWSLKELESALGKENGNKLFDSLPPTNQGNINKLPQIIDTKIIPLKLQLQWLSILKKEKKNKPLPLKDEKRLIAHNSLLVSGFVDAAVALNDISFLIDAIKLEKWISSTFLNKNFDIKSYVYPTDSTISYGNLDDYCFYIQSLLDISAFANLVEHNTAAFYINKAEEVLNNTILKFQDQQMNGFFFSDNSLELQPPCRRKIWYDNATPSANSSLLRIFSTLYHLTGKDNWQTHYNQASNAYSQLARKAPEGVSHGLTAICEEAIGLVTLKIPDDYLTEALEVISTTTTSRKIFINPENEPIYKIQFYAVHKKEAIQIDELNLFSGYLEN